MLKGLPLADDRDLSEDKWATVEAVDALAPVLPAMAGMVATMRVDRERLRVQSTAGFTLATAVADWLARGGRPFSEAREVTRGQVRHCASKGIALPGLTPAALAVVDARLTPEVPTDKLSCEGSSIPRRSGVLIARTSGLRNRAPP